jgi:hypothetical protein
MTSAFFLVFCFILIGISLGFLFSEYLPFISAVTLLEIILLLFSGKVIPTLFLPDFLKIIMIFTPLFRAITLLEMNYYAFITHDFILLLISVLIFAFSYSIKKIKEFIFGF